MGHQKPEFDATKWFRNQYIKEAGLEEDKGTPEGDKLLAEAFNIMKNKGWLNSDAPSNISYFINSINKEL
jgi:hypothetical protein